MQHFPNILAKATAEDPQIAKMVANESELNVSYA